MDHKNIQKKLQSTYNNIAVDFNEKRSKTWSQIENFLDKNRFIGNKDIVMLDMFCGSGRFSFFDINTISIDFSLNMLKVIEKKKKSKENSPHPVLCDCLKLPFADDSFDCAICVAGIHHFKLETERKQVIMEMKRVLKKGGKFIISTWSRNAFEKGTPKDYFCQWDKKYFRYYYLFDQKEFEELIKSCGLKIDCAFEGGIKKAKNIWVEGEME